MYDLSWCRQQVDAWKRTTTRGLLFDRLFDQHWRAIVERYPDAPVTSLDSALAYVLAASQHDSTAADLWEFAKYAEKHRARPLEIFWQERHTIAALSYVIRRGHAWVQRELPM